MKRFYVVVVVLASCSLIWAQPNDTSHVTRSPDFDGNGVVDISDFLLFVEKFGSRQGDGKYEAKYDLDGNGSIGISDFLRFANDFGKAVKNPMPVSIPDANLRAVIAQNLGKASNAPITDTEMATLTRLDAISKNISDLTGLEFATNLTYLNVGVDWSIGSSDKNNAITDISPIGKLTNLTQLELTFNKISDISALTGLSDLKYLDIGGNNVSDISVLANLTKLETLYFWGNNFSDISAVANLTELRTLGFNSEKHISDISALANLTMLEHLGIGYNNISDISALASLINLKTLDLQVNDISDISVLANLTKLTRLELQQNRISDVSPLSSLISLTTLHLSHNFIFDISPLSNLTNLKTLSLDDNFIADISSLAANMGLGNGDQVDLRHNALNSTSVHTHIPALQGREAAVQFSDAMPDAIFQTFCYGDGHQLRTPHFTYLNNAWGRGDITDYEQCLLKRVVGDNTEYGWRWRWPQGTGGVKAYPEVIHGHVPWWRHPLTLSDLPRRISSINKLQVNYDVEMTVQGVYNLAFEMWLTIEKPPTRNITHEIMIWVDRTFEPQSREFLVTQVEIDGVAYDLYINPEFGHFESPFKYIAFASHTDQFRGTLNFEKFLNYLVDNGHLTADHYVNSVELGNEVIEGTGETWIKKLQIDVQ